MATRSIAEYIRPAELEPAAIAATLPSPLHLGDEQTSNGARAFYDTFDGRLLAEQLRLVHRDGLLMLESSDGHELAAAPHADTPETLHPADLDPRLRDRVAPICDIRVLLLLGRLEGERRTLPVLDDEEKTVVRIVSEGERLQLLGVRGYDQAFARVCTAIESGLGLARSAETLDEQLRADQPPAADREPLTAELASDRAAVVLCTRLLHVIEANLPGTLANLDTEFLHDFRVAVRRTRALLRELKTVFPPEKLEHFRAEFKWLQQVTGPSRDLDVYLLEFGEPRALRDLLEERQGIERVEMETQLRSDRARDLFVEWSAFLDRLPDMPAYNRPDAVTPIGELSSRRIARVYRQMVKMGRAIDDGSPHEALHDLRKKGKELRYLLEFFAPLFPAKVTKPMVKTLKSLQDSLGRFQDREVQADMIRGLANQLAGDPAAAPTLMSIGVLVERLGRQQHEARAQFTERFAAFASKDQRALVKKTFG